MVPTGQENAAQASAPRKSSVSQRSYSRKVHNWLTLTATHDCQLCSSVPSAVPNILRDRLEAPMCFVLDLYDVPYPELTQARAIIGPTLDSSLFAAHYHL